MLIWDRLYSQLSPFADCVRLSYSMLPRPVGPLTSHTSLSENSQHFKVATQLLTALLIPILASVLNTVPHFYLFIPFFFPSALLNICLPQVNPQALFRCVSLCLIRNTVTSPQTAEQFDSRGGGAAGEVVVVMG